MTLIYFLATFGFLCALPAGALLSILLTRRQMTHVPGAKSSLAKDGPGPDLFARRPRHGTQAHHG
ncbi:hypothetical protein AN189_08620 [Loktanella sp. 3ANDIMAR09]|nr:hypothetical protein AN189_08620 [Loktanella sp. 3ANDIMAR09]